MTSRFRRHSSSALLSLLLGPIVAVGCGGPDSLTGSPSGQPNTPWITQISVQPNSVALAVGETVQLVATGPFIFGRITPLYRWESSNPAVAVVSQRGLVRALSSGSAIVTVSAGQNTGIAQVTVR